MAHSSTTPLDQRQWIPSAQGAAAPIVNYETRLELSRRIDWRFLFPNPRVGRVACLGTPDLFLREALNLFSEVVEFVAEGHSPAKHRKSYETVIVCPGTNELVDQAATLIAPGGRIYIELPRRWFSPSKPARAAARLQQLGFQNVALHWHWPNFISCKSMLPLSDDGSAVRYLIEHRGGGLAQRAKAVLGRFALSTGVLAMLPRSISIIGERPIA